MGTPAARIRTRERAEPLSPAEDLFGGQWPACPAPCLAVFGAMFLVLAQGSIEPRPMLGLVLAHLSMVGLDGEPRDTRKGPQYLRHWYT